MPSIFFWKRKRKQNKRKDDKSTNTATSDEATTTQPPAGDTSANNSAIIEQALPSVPQPIVEASYAVLTRGSSDNESENTEPGYSVVTNNKTVTSPNRGTTINQHSLTATANDNKVKDTSLLQNDNHNASADNEKSQPIFDVDPEQLYSKVVSKKKRQQKSVTDSHSEYSYLHHNKEDDGNVRPAVCSPQLYSILDSPHRTIPTPARRITKHTSIDFTNDSNNSSTSSDDYKPHRRHKSFQPIVYLPPRPSSEKRQESGSKRSRRHRDDSGMVARSTSTDCLKKNEFLVQGTTLDGSVTLYAASPVGNPIPADQAGPILNRLSSRPLSRLDHTTPSCLEQSVMDSQPLPSPHPSLDQQQSLEQSVMMQKQQHLITPPINVNQPVLTSPSLTTSVDLPDHHRHHAQTLSYSSPAAVASLDHSDHYQDKNYNGTKPLSANLDQTIPHNSNNNRSLTDNDAHQDQHTSSSLYRDMLELMQKRETELSQHVNAITADKERLLAEKTLLQRENESSRETIPMLHSQMSALQVENQMLQLTIEKLNEELSNLPHNSSTHGPVCSSESRVSDVTDINIQTSQEQPMPTSNSTVTKTPHQQQSSLMMDAHSLGLSDNASSWSRSTLKSPLEENTILVKELQRQQELIKEMKQDHKSELSKMSRKLQRAYHDRDNLIDTVANMEEKQKQLKESLSVANDTISHQISLSDHQQSIKELQQMLDELMATHEAVTSAQADKLNSLKREKKSLTNKLTKAKNIIVELESQCTGLHKVNRRLKEQLDRLQENIELSRDRENFIHNELSKAVLKAEKTAIERDALAQLAHSQQVTSERATEKRKKDKSTINHLKRKLNQQQPSTGEVITTDDIDYAYSTDQELARQQEHCQEAIKHIKLLERSKQEELRKTTGSRNPERHLDKLWKAAVTPK